MASAWACTVQQAIENLEIRLNPDQESRIRNLKDRIKALEAEVAAAEGGDFEVLSGSQAGEGVREVYQLAMSLRADFRRVEDSYREADRTLRQRILGEDHHRGEIVDKLLDSHQELVGTPEGQVFENFYEQLLNPTDLEKMKDRLRTILDNEASSSTLSRRQRKDLQGLNRNLVQESEGVIQARARSEGDVRAFLKSGLADEHVRVGALLQETLRHAAKIDWTSQKMRKTPSPSTSSIRIRSPITWARIFGKPLPPSTALSFLKRPSPFCRKTKNRSPLASSHKPSLPLTI